MKLQEADPDSAAAFKDLTAKTNGYQQNEDADRIPWNDKACAIMDDFIRNPEGRPLITVNGHINVPAGIELKDYDMAFFDSLKEKMGLTYSSVYLYQDIKRHTEDPLAPESMGTISAELTCSGWYISYERYVRKPFEDFYIEYEEEYYRESSRDGKIKLEEQASDSRQSLLYVWEQ